MQRTTYWRIFWIVFITSHLLAFAAQNEHKPAFCQDGCIFICVDDKACEEIIEEIQSGCTALDAFRLVRQYHTIPSFSASTNDDCLEWICNNEELQRKITRIEQDVEVSLGTEQFYALS